MDAVAWTIPATPKLAAVLIVAVRPVRSLHPSRSNQTAGLEIPIDGRDSTGILVGTAWKRQPQSGKSTQPLAE